MINDFYLMQFDLFEIKHQCWPPKYTDSNVSKVSKQRGMGGKEGGSNFFNKKGARLLKIGGGYF